MYHYVHSPGTSWRRRHIQLSNWIHQALLAIVLVAVSQTQRKAFDRIPWRPLPCSCHPPTIRDWQWLSPSVYVMVVTQLGTGKARNSIYWRIVHSQSYYHTFIAISFSPFLVIRLAASISWNAVLSNSCFAAWYNFLQPASQSHI